MRLVTVAVVHPPLGTSLGSLNPRRIQSTLSVADNYLHAVTVSASRFSMRPQSLVPSFQR
jgi:hypothetical protein